MRKLKAGKRTIKQMFLYGRISVQERLRVEPATVKKVMIQDNVSLPAIEKLIKSGNIPCERVSAKRLAMIKPAKDLQGVIARIEPFRYTSYDDLLTRVSDNKISLILLDRINDPHNLGAVIRTAACLGGFAVVIPQFHACPVTDAALHVASGGENYVSVSMVSSLSTAILQAKECGCWIFGADASEQSLSLNEVSFPFPLGFVLGSEGEGIRYGVQKHLDMRVHIPMKGAPLSLNVSAACAVLCHEIITQKRGAR